ncbi:hypothetical protein UFOVP625_32 [uncultured Caudovirales phage]|uniref:Uncharacterized protein n=1 Tax=uncultured Caudovirales phage TaxID=2100421 RepID=A0A6J5N621_9CAUD|nr:hypothetical protein UFOVP625_32 [uncultured Caudovirales phage]
MPSYVYKSGSPTTVTSGTNVYVYTGSSTTARANYIKVYNGSSWVTVYQYDTTPPSGGGISSIVWNQAIPGFTVNYNSTSDADSGLASYTLQYSSNGSSYSDVGAISTSGGAYSYAISSGGRGATHYFRTVAVDNVGLSTTSSALSKVAKPLGDFLFVPTSGDSWNGSQWMGFNANYALYEATVRYSTTYPYGAYFFGSSIVDACKGYAADSGTAYFQRAGASQNNRGNTGTFSFRAHDLISNGSQFTGATFTGTTASVYISGNDGFGSVSIPSDWLTAFANASAYGIGLTGHDAPPGFLRGGTVSSNFNPFLIYSGTVGLTFN